MSMIEVTQGERGVVRVFALSMDAGEADALRNAGADEAGPSPVATILGASGIDTSFVEVFPVSDVAEIGLDRYLEEGNGIDPDQLGPDRGKLKALDGWVMLVYSAAFGGRGGRLNPAPELALIGTYAEPGIDWSDKSRLTSSAAHGTSPRAKKPPSDAAMSGRVALIVLLVLFLLTGVVIWIAA